MSEKTITPGSGNIFTDLGFGPEEAQNLLLRAQVRTAILIWYTQSGLKQSPAAKQLAITQPRFNQLLNGKINEFSLDALVNIAAAAGLQMNMNVEPFPQPQRTNPKTTPSSTALKPPAKRGKKAA